MLFFLLPLCLALYPSYGRAWREGIKATALKQTLTHVHVRATCDLQLSTLMLYLLSQEVHPASTTTCLRTPSLHPNIAYTAGFYVTR